jgi:hypothetical protein
MPKTNKTIFTLPCYGMWLRLHRTKDGMAGEIFSDLHEGDAGVEDDTEYEAAIDAIESLILAHACAGVDVTTPAYVEGIETAVTTATNNLL